MLHVLVLRAGVKADKVRGGGCAGAAAAGEAPRGKKKDAWNPPGPNKKRDPTTAGTSGERNLLRDTERCTPYEHDYTVEKRGSTKEGRGLGLRHRVSPGDGDEQDHGRGQGPKT